MSLCSDETKGRGNVCMNQHATLIGDKGVGCIVGELVAQLNESKAVDRPTPGCTSGGVVACRAGSAGQGSAYVGCLVISGE